MVRHCQEVCHSTESFQVFAKRGIATRNFHHNVWSVAVSFFSHVDAGLTMRAVNFRIFQKRLWVVFLLVSCLIPGWSASQEPGIETSFFNGRNLAGWQGDMKFWSVQDGVIIGSADKNFDENQFLWSEVEVSDFYLVVDVRLTPNQRNAGIQFRSRRLRPGSNQAFGYQADVGRGVWGRLYHEHGRQRLDWTDRGEKAVKPGAWNRYEILAIKHRIWTAINGKLSVAVEDPDGERNGKIAFQIHSGPAQKVEYRVVKLVHHPEISIAGRPLLEATKKIKVLSDSRGKTLVRRRKIVTVDEPMPKPG